MVKKLITASTLVLLLASFSPATAQKGKQTANSSAAKQPKFLDDIEVGYGAPAETNPEVFKNAKPAETPVNKKDIAFASNTIESANNLQLKYSILLNAEVEQVQNIKLFQLIDEWYGTRYALGGSSKSGIDCSAFVQVLYSNLFNIPMPRTAKEQYKATHNIARSEIKQGDLVFFNTIGGVSHVGMYLQNNKFVHASSSGVTISDLDDDYWAKRFISAGRYDKVEEAVALTVNP